MDYLMLITVCFYLLSSTAYIVFLFAQREYLHRAGHGLLMAAFAVHTVTLAATAVQAGQMPVQNLHGTLSVAAWALAGTFLLLHVKYRLNILGIYAAPLITFVMIIVFQLPQPAAPADGLFRNLWLIFHVVTIFIGEAAFALACGAGLLYLAQEKAIKSKKRGFFYTRLPSLELIDTTGYACIVVGFTLLTVGLITGFMYAKSIWGRFWGWDPKEVWSGISWLLYAALLHGRFAVGWRGRKAAVMAIIGFAVLLFTFFGVNFLMKGHHGVFTKF